MNEFHCRQPGSITSQVTPLTEASGDIYTYSECGGFAFASQVLVAGAKRWSELAQVASGATAVTARHDVTKDARTGDA